jgi:hypothetical protein
MTRFPVQIRLAAIVALASVLSACGGPDLVNESDVTAVPTSTVVSVAPTAAVGATTGAPCESGILEIRDLVDVESTWREGLASARARAILWQDDAVLIEFSVSCELFEAGFRWQATFFSRTAQAYYTSDTAEVIPVNLNPDTIIPLPEREIDFVALHDVLITSEGLSISEDDEIDSLDVRVSTDANHIGPPGVPTGAAIYHVALDARGEVLELYIDAVKGDIFTYE